MILLLLLLLVILLIIAYPIFKLNFLSPTIISILTYMFSACILAVNSGSWGVKLSLHTCIVIIIGLLFIFLGEYSAKYVRFFSHENNRNVTPASPNCYSVILPRSNFLGFVIIYMSLIFFWYLFSVKSQVILSGIDGAMLSVYREIDNNTNIFLYFFLTINFPISLLFILSYLQNLLLINRNKLILLVPVIIYISTSILSSGRMNILYIFVVIFSISYILYHQRTSWRTNFRFRNIMKLFIFLSLVLVGFYSLGFLTGKSNEQSLLYIISLYTSSSIAALNTFLESFKYEIENFGGETLVGIYNILDYLGFNLAFKPNRILDFVKIPGMPTGTNIYTASRRILSDYGYIGLVLYNFLIGFVFQKVYAKIIVESQQKSIYRVLIYVYLYRYLVFQFIDERLIINLFSLTTLIDLLALRYIYKYCFLIRKVRVKKTSIDISHKMKSIM